MLRSAITSGLPRPCAPAPAGAYALRGAAFGYQTGPDGKRYAVASEVHIDTAPVVGDQQRGHGNQ